MDRPNILCVSIDSLRVDYTSLLEGRSQNTTPFLNSLTSESAVYEHATTPSTWTLPVHTSVFTGLYPPEHGVITGEKILGAHPTFAERLSEEGYATKAFYKNGWLDTGGITRGFDTPTRNESTSSNSTKSSKKRLSELIGRFSPETEIFLEQSYEVQKQYRQWKRESGNSRERETGGRDTINKALNNVKETSQPFCWFLHLNDAHWKYNPPNPYHQKFTDQDSISLAYNYGFWQEKVYGTRTNRLKTTVGDINPPERAVQTFKNLYRGGVRYCDRLIEELIEGLKEADVWDNTVLIVFGDHGDGFGEDGVFGHHFSVHDSIIRVPLLIRDPTDQIDPGIISGPASLVDIYPTVAQLTDVDLPKTNAVDLITEDRDYSYTYYDISDYEYYTEADQRGISKNRLPPSSQYVIWESEDSKGIKYPQSGDFVQYGKNRELLERLDEHTEQLIKVPIQKGEMSDDVANRLEDLGYLQE